VPISGSNKIKVNKSKESRLLARKKIQLAMRPNLNKDITYLIFKCFIANPKSIQIKKETNSEKKFT